MDNVEEPSAAQLSDEDLQAILEAMLFLSPEPVSALVFAAQLEVDLSRVESALLALEARTAQPPYGVRLRQVAGGWQLLTKEQWDPYLEKYVLSWDTRKLSSAALETLAITAYLQPVTRAQLAAVRGVNSDSPLNSLVEKGLVREVGVADSPGNPVLYGTSKKFLEHFGLMSLASLPPLEDFAPDEETRRLISERLSATQSSVLDQELTIGLPEQDPEVSDASEAIAADPQEALRAEQEKFVSAVADAFGLVNPINFDELTFETDDE